ncbi:MAG TPA: histidine kinase dimerization/phospho-acceptor domain-containing protein, partial [Roseateles sp.]
MSEQPDSERVVIFAPTGRDADVTLKLLAGAGIDGVVAQDWRQVGALIRDGSGALIVTDATLAEPGADALRQVLEAQPSWSDLPVLALCRHGQEVPALREARVRNLTVLDRPASMRTVVSAVQTALRGRRWQYQIRDQIESLRLADQRKDEFLATLAHELRNPLAPIRSGLQLLARLPDDARRRSEVTAMMERQMRQLLRLIDDLLEVSRITRGKVAL